MQSEISNISLQPTWRDYLELCKPKVVLLMLLTAWVGMIMATSPATTPWRALIFGSIGIALAASSAAVINHIIERHIDIKMQRTHNRPVAQGRVSRKQALTFSGLIGLLGLSILAIMINPLTAWLTLFTLLGYSVIYTVYLKHATPQNIVIGGLAGALPPLLGWTAVANQVDPNSLLLVLIIFAWTPPHFWALAIYRKKDYQNANLPMLPVTHGVKFTKISIVLYTLIMIATTLLPFVFQMSGYIYLTSALLLNAGFLYYALKLYFTHDKRVALVTFGFSIIYLMSLFIALVLDHYVIYLLYYR